MRVFTPGADACAPAGARIAIAGGCLALERDAAPAWLKLRARMPDAGGWAPADIRIPAGEDLHLRLTSDDVMHSFAIGQSTLPAIDLYPGKTVETTLRFDQPGKYTYYCTRWCGADHWRMRGTIEVTGSRRVLSRRRLSNRCL